MKAAFEPGQGCPVAGVSINAIQMVSNVAWGTMMGHLPLGKVVATPGAIELLSEAGEDAFCYLARHATGDWGELCAFDRRQNEIALREGYRIFCSYPVGGDCVWIITEADRSVTTILLPEDY